MFTIKVAEKRQVAQPSLHACLPACLPIYVRQCNNPKISQTAKTRWMLWCIIS
jgi:hypothetical protein